MTIYASTLAGVRPGARVWLRDCLGPLDALVTRREGQLLTVVYRVGDRWADDQIEVPLKQVLLSHPGPGLRPGSVPRATLVALLTLLAAREEGPEGLNCWVSVDELAGAMQCSRTTALARCRQLAERGIVPAREGRDEPTAVYWEPAVGAIFAGIDYKALSAAAAIAERAGPEDFYRELSRELVRGEPALQPLFAPNMLSVLRPDSAYPCLVHLFGRARAAYFHAEGGLDL